MKRKQFAGAPVPSRDALGGEEQEYYDALGPWATERAVSDALDMSTDSLALERQHHALLGVKFGGSYYFPVHQFNQGRVINGLALALEALDTGFPAPEMQAGWFAEQAYEDEPVTRWDVLRSGEVSTILQWAKDDAAWASRP